MSIIPGSPEWHASVKEEIINPEQRIIDPHHHLWQRERLGNYLLEQLLEDTGSGHKVEQTVFIECGSDYRQTGPEHLKPLGETEFVAAQAKLSDESDGATIAAIVSHADLRLGKKVKEVLEGHEALGQGRFRGIRHAGAHAHYPEVLLIPGRAPENLYQREDFRSGVRLLGNMGYTYDTWHYHYQNQDFCELAKAVPETSMILDHFGTPLGVGPYSDHIDEIYAQWKIDIKEISKCENVIAKIGGLAMPDNGFGWHSGKRPPTSDEFVKAQRAYYLHTIECFGPERCMFESNFPVDRMSLSYHVLYNGFKKIVADFTEDEKDAMFYGTAARVYRI